MKIIIPSVLVFLLMSCSNDSSIQASYLDGYNSLSVGEAFNNWRMCDSTSWESFETDNGTSIVEYQCTQFDEISETRENLGTLISNATDMNVGLIGFTACAEYMLNLEEGCIFDVQGYLDTLANPITFAIQFTFNRNDTFEISYIGFETSKSQFTADLNEVDEYLEIIYGDSVWADDYVDQIVTSLSKTIAPKVSMPEARGGGTYIGEVVNGVPEGTGTWTTTEDLIHKGEFRNGLPNGFGVLTYPNGTNYEGNFTDDFFNGQGTLTFANGSVYAGEFRDGDYNGQGTYTYVDGEVYVGEWMDDQRSGQGVLRNADGSIEYEGIWVNDAPIDQDI